MTKNFGVRADGSAAKDLKPIMFTALMMKQIWMGASAFSFSVSLPFMRKRPRPFFAHGEYWVYLPSEDMPSQEEIMNRMLLGNPHRIDGKLPITKNEALIFSDVRLQIALVLRSRNAHVFRPDLFNEHVEPTAA